ncbi:hypothetical protein, partial [Crocosphaera watsonii]|uniref:hypothetical protein n=1 Tax=Crocosphaera watsonii TaxID=263511 RepID=UPI0012E0AD64
MVTLSFILKDEMGNDIDSVVLLDDITFRKPGVNAFRLTTESELINSNTIQEISDESLQPIFESAITLWKDAGISSEQINKLQSAKIEFADLGSGLLGTTFEQSIILDKNAAGYGWFVDLTPLNNEEFIENGLNLVALENSSAVNKIDLVTVIAHEMGHLLNLPDFDYRDTSIMGGLLSPGMRKLGISEEIQNLLTIDSEFSIVDNLEDASEEKSLDSYNITSESLLSDVILPITGSYEVTQINKPHLFTSFLQINSTNTTNITNNSLLNGDFNITEQTEPNFGWNIEGNASIINEAMNLNEDSTVNTRLSQTF